MYCALTLFSLSRVSTAIKLFFFPLLLICLFLTAPVLQADETPTPPTTTECSAEAPTATNDEKQAAEAKPKSYFCSTWWSLFPALLAIVLALITKEVYSSLFAGIVIGGCFVAEFSPLSSFDFIVQKGIIDAVTSTSGIFVFLVVLGAFVVLINRAGAAAAFGRWAQQHIKSRIGSQLATFIMGILIFIDDYFNCLTVGNVMRPVTDSQRISRAKLAYIVDATAAPVCMIAPISSWAAAVSQYAEGTGYNGLELFIKAIPYNFYSLLSLCFVVMIIVMKVDFGSMARHEFRAIKSGKLVTVAPGSHQHSQDIPHGPRHKKSKLIDLIIPVFLLIGLGTFALVYVGGILDGKSFAEALSNTDATVGLPWGSLIALIIVILFFMARRLISFKQAIACIPEGFATMVPAILILTMATALKNVTTALEAKEFIAFHMEHSAAGLAHFLPAVIFIVASILAFSTGTSWATFGILIPIVVSTFDPSSPLLYIGMSACLAGAVCGDHCSPISDTTIMSSAGAQCDHLSHVSTQLPYVIIVAIVSFFAFLVAGFINNWYLVFPLSLIALFIALLIIKKRSSVLKRLKD